MALAGLIGGALKGDARSLMALETTGIDDALLREAVGLVAGGSAGGAAIAVGQFAATIILRHARTSEGADLGALCTECLQLAATPGLPTNRQRRSAAAAAATRAGPEAALQVHAEAMRLARLGQLAEAVVDLRPELDWGTDGGSPRPSAADASPAAMDEST